MAGAKKGAPVTRARLTAAQALVRDLAAQRVEAEGAEVPLLAAVRAIFGQAGDAQVIGAVGRAAGTEDIAAGAAGSLPGERHKLWRAARPGARA